MKIELKLDALERRVYLGEIFMEERVFMYSLNYPHDTII